MNCLQLKLSRSTFSHINNTFLSKTLQPTFYPTLVSQYMFLPSFLQARRTLAHVWYHAFTESYAVSYGCRSNRKYCLTNIESHPFANFECKIFVVCCNTLLLADRTLNFVFLFYLCFTSLLHSPHGALLCIQPCLLLGRVNDICFQIIVIIMCSPSNLTHPTLMHVLQQPMGG